MLKKTDKGIIREYMNEGNPLVGEQVVLKLYQYTDEGDPTIGVAKTFIYNYERDYAVITAIEQQDIVYSGGIYQIGDIKAQLLRELKPIDDVTKSPGDRIVWRGHEYRQVGRIAVHYLEGYNLFDYVFRRV